MRRFTYTPTVKAYINISEPNNPNFGQTIDISQDIISGSVTRNLEAVSSAQLQLQNKEGKYLGGYSNGRNKTFSGYIFTPMDRIIISMSRIGDPFLVFSGYLDSVTAFQLYPDQITLSASCTLKRLLYTWIDPTVVAINGFFSNLDFAYILSSGMIWEAGGGQLGNLDVTGTIGDLLYDILTQLGGWQSDTVEIIDFPASFLDGIESATNNTKLKKTVSNAAGGSNNNIFSSSYSPPGSSSGSGQNTTSSGNNYSNGFRVTYTDIIQGLMARGVALLDACAVAGRAMQENSLNTNSSPETTDSAGQIVGGFGLWQWNGSRIEDLINFARQEGGNPVDLKIQLDFLIHENNTDESGPWQAVVSSPDLATKEIVFSSQWERGDLGNAVSYAQDALSAITRLYPGIQSDASQYLTQIRSVSNSNDSKYSINSNIFGSSNVAAISSANYIQSTAIGTVLGVASSQIGVTEQPPGSNGGPQVDQYLASVGLKSGEPWCAAFVHWVFEKAGLGSLEPASGSVPTVWADLKPSQQISNNGKNTPQPGDLIFYGSTPGDLHHMGIITRANSDGTVDTIEGNTGGDPNASAQQNENGIWVTTHSEVSLSDSGYPVYGFGRITNNPAQIGEAIASSTGGMSNSNTVVGSDINHSVQPSNIQWQEGYIGYLPITPAPLFPTILPTTLDKAHELVDTIPLFQWVQDFCSAGARTFCSAPNGDFLSFFPDYFGWFGTTPYFKIDDIEIVSLDVQLSDENLQTHVFGIGPFNAYTQITNRDYAVSPIASVQEKAFNYFINTNPNITPGPDGTAAAQNIVQTFYVSGSFDPDAFMQRYGARPLIQQFPNIRNPTLLWLATWLQFMQSWALTYTAQAEFTFMPELIPGGRVNIADKVSMFINSVTHDWNYQTGFSTSADLIAVTVDGTTLSGETTRVQEIGTQLPSIPIKTSLGI